MKYIIRRLIGVELLLAKYDDAIARMQPNKETIKAIIIEFKKLRRYGIDKTRVICIVEKDVWVG